MTIKEIVYDEGGNIHEVKGQGGEYLWGSKDEGIPNQVKQSSGYTMKTMSLYGFFERIPNEEAALGFVEAVRWGDGFYCPRCTSESISRNKDDKPMPYRCRSCRKHFSVRTNSVLSHTNIPPQEMALCNLSVSHRARGRVQPRVRPPVGHHAEVRVVYGPPHPRGARRTIRSSARRSRSMRLT